MIRAGNRIRSSLRLAPAVVSVLLTACQSVPPVEPSVAQAHHLNNYGRNQEAADRLQPIIDATPGVWSVEYEFGRAQLGLGNYEQARRSLERANARVPRNIDVIFALADTYTAQKDTSKLYELLRNAGTQLRSSEAWIRLAKAADELGDPDTAMEAINAAIEVDDGFDVRRGTECYFVASQLEAKYGTADASLRRLRQAYGVNSEDPRVRLALEEAGVPLNARASLPPGP